MKNKKPFTTEEQFRKFKKRYFIQTTITILVLLGAGCYLFCNYDYFVFKHLISQNYFDTSTLDTLYKEELALSLEEKDYYRYFDELVISIVTNRIYETGGDRYTYLYSPEGYAQMKADDKEEADDSFWEPLSDQTAYIRITNFSKYTNDFFHGNASDLKTFNNIILDLRGNRGGSIDAYHDMADLFLDTGAQIAKNITRQPFFTQEIVSKTPAVFDFQRIVILQDHITASSSEGFIAALKDNLDTVTLIGETTYGKGIGQITLPLTKGFAVKATVFRWFSPKGFSIHQNGIQPDIFYNPDAKDIISYAQKYCEQVN